VSEAVNLDDPQDAPHGHRPETGSVAKRSGRKLRVVPDHRGPAQQPTAAWEIRTVDGVEGERLAAQQARVLWEVTEWLAQNKS
jgi:hypothetical protein